MNPNLNVRNTATRCRGRRRQLLINRPNFRQKERESHRFRISIASEVFLYEVQQILGHSDSKVTERYAHLSTATLQDAANSVGTYLDKALNSTDL